MSIGISNVSLVQQTPFYHAACSTKSSYFSLSGNQHHAGICWTVNVNLAQSSDTKILKSSCSLYSSFQWVALRFPTLCSPYQASDPQVIERQCHQINSYTMGHCFPGNRGRKASRRFGTEWLREREEGLKGRSDEVDWWEEMDAGMITVRENRAEWHWEEKNEERRDVESDGRGGRVITDTERKK